MQEPLVKLPLFVNLVLPIPCGSQWSPALPLWVADNGQSHWCCLCLFFCMCCYLVTAKQAGVAGSPWLPRPAASSGSCFHVSSLTYRIRDFLLTYRGFGLGLYLMRKTVLHLWRLYVGKSYCRSLIWHIFWWIICCNSDLRMVQHPTSFGFTQCFFLPGSNYKGIRSPLSILSCHAKLWIPSNVVGLDGTSRDHLVQPPGLRWFRTQAVLCHRLIEN